MGVEVIVLNGGSSSGKSSIATCLQEQLDGTWLTLGIDDLIRALSHGPHDRGAGGTLTITPEGSLSSGRPSVPLNWRGTKVLLPLLVPERA